MCVCVSVCVHVCMCACVHVCTCVCWFHVLFVTQTGDVSDHYPIEFELLGKMNCS